MDRPGTAHVCGRCCLLVFISVQHSAWRHMLGHVDLNAISASVRSSEPREYLAYGGLMVRILHSRRADERLLTEHSKVGIS